VRKFWVLWGVATLLSLAGGVQWLLNLGWWTVPLVALSAVNIYALVRLRGRAQGLVWACTTVGGLVCLVGAWPLIYQWKMVCPLLEWQAAALAVTGLAWLSLKG
jgi:hypothetical protein